MNHLLKRAANTVLFLLSSCCVVQAQSTLDPFVLRALDTALLTIGMRPSDLTMPPDLIDHDKHRTFFHDALFTDPLYAVDVATRDAEALGSRTDEALTEVLRQMMARMNLGSLVVTPYDGRMTADEVVEALGSDPTTRLNIVSSFLVLRFLSAVVQAADAIAPARKSLLKMPSVVDQMDSLWMMHTDDETASLWHLAAEERRGRQIAQRLYSDAAPRTMEEVYSHGISLLLQFRSYVSQAVDNADLLADSVRTVSFKTPLGRIGIGGPGPDVWEGSYSVIIDVGGNDVYRLDDTTKTDALYMPVRCIIDLAGNDSYLGGSYSYASGVGGIGILIDKSGNDTYTAGDFSLASGLFGIGILHDMAGNDTYLSGVNSQGSGIFGIGLLLDDSGHDTYRCHAQSQAFAGTRGVGVLSDISGNDTYIAASPFVDVLRYDAHQVTFAQGAALGSRPIASGGYALLADAQGNDTYVSDIYGQGTGYWFALGALVDGSGDDRYQSYQYAQGSGVHFASGVLRDRSGSDVYVSHGVSMGCGHDIATGVLLDESGNDTYATESLSLGGGNANAISLFIDERGNDAYTALNTSNTMGFSDLRRSYGMIGVFLDMDGTDVYGEPLRNNAVQTKSTYGVFVDRSTNTTTVSSSSVETPAGSSDALSSDIDSLFIQASAAPLRFQSAVEPARKKLSEMGTRALRLCEENASTQMPRERLTLEYVLPKLYASLPDSTLATLSRLISSDNMAEMNLGCTVAGKVRATACVPQLIITTLDSSWKKRRIAAFTLGEISDTSATSALKMLLRDEHPYVRQRAAYALGQLQAPNFAYLTSALEDEEQIVRYAAVEGMLRGPRLSMLDLTSWYRGVTDNAALVGGMKLLRNADTSAAAVKVFTAWYSRCPQWIAGVVQREASSMPAVLQAALLPAVQKKKRTSANKR